MNFIELCGKKTRRRVDGDVFIVLLSRTTVRPILIGLDLNVDTILVQNIERIIDYNEFIGKASSKVFVLFSR